MRKIDVPINNLGGSLKLPEAPWEELLFPNSTDSILLLSEQPLKEKIK